MSLNVAVTPQGTFGMGRIPSVYDRRNENFLIEDMRDATPRVALKDRLWVPGPLLNQGSTPSCTGHAARGWELCSPVADPVDSDDANVPDTSATPIWARAQEIEFGHSDPNDGATIHGIAKALHEASGPLVDAGGKPRMRSYVWAHTLGGALYYLSTRGPLIVGISWYNSMFNPSSDGLLTVDPQSGLAGGHALLAYGVSIMNRLIRIRNSWGAWGVGGDCFMTFDDFAQLCFRQAGEVCAGVESPLATVAA